MTSTMTPTRALPPRWLTPVERPDMWKRAMDEWHADVVEERKRNPPPPSKPMSEYEQDDRDTEKMLSGIDAAIVELRFMHTAPAAWARALEPGKYPCLCSVGKRAGRVGEDRFRGRYHPHLIYDRAAR